MKNKLYILIIVFIIGLNLNTATAEPVENDFGIVNAWYNGQEATVRDVQLKVGEPVEIKIYSHSKINCDVYIKLINPLITMPYDLISGPSEIDELIEYNNVEPSWSQNFTWIVKPNGEWTNGNAPINLFIQLSDRDENRIVEFTIANPYILDEHYSGPSRTTTDPPSPNQTSPLGSPGFGVAGALLGIALVMMARRN